MTERNQQRPGADEPSHGDGTDDAAGTADGDGDGAGGPSRRQFLGATASAGALAGLGVEFEGAAAQAQDGEGFFAQGPEVGVEMVADGDLVAPTDFAEPAGDGTMQFVADQTGQVYVIAEDGLREEPFVDVSDRMVELGTFYGLYADRTGEYDERGLIGIETHPEFQENGRFYLHYSAPPTPALRAISYDHVEVVSEFQASDDLTSADPESERELLRIPSPQYNHDGGPMAFGPDGYLYVPMGDGGGANDNLYGHSPDWYERNTGGNGQDVVTNLLGDVLRIDVDGGTAEGSQDGGGDAAAGDDRPYGIPEDNPFAGEDSAGRDEIYAYGFRNPFGISFDSEGNCFVADAGQNLFEEVDLVERGGNYGWNVKEGTHCFSTEEPGDATAITDCPQREPNEAPYDGSPLVDPIVEFPHQYDGEFVGITVVGGHRYEADAIGDLQGQYVYGAWTTDPTRVAPQGRILAAAPPGGEVTQTGNATAGNETPPVADNETGAIVGDEPNATDDNVTTDNVTTDNVTAGDGMDDGVGNETDNVTEDNETVELVENETAEKAPMANVTNETETGQEPGEVPPPGEEVVPRDRLWEMTELQVQGGFNWFVRMFGQGQDGEVYVLVNQRGVPEGDTGAVLRLVPPEEGDPDVAAGNVTAGNATDGANVTDGNVTEDGAATANATAENESAD